ncbi:MAG: SMC-Scp complex subunit ScpB [Bacteroidia bacterium]|nr:SMC-Scp complex subunit ScpB [Bacteroidota bacterium]MBK8416257.1 SMC-Scp complex subunit ScpB [Bacteroidota bacterium]MBK8872777.1 SMC-Scp complex subunit ScpB [Bacteroidota bacterium]MBK9422795.1 SMC-Scp complex subunit ScpB [Bacteroidota bacterium]MBP9083467.1 SMC-Scp complex subunit ScpB [Bacteroidia bacterium]
MKLLKQHIEALIFTTEQAITPDEMISCLKAVYGWDLKKDDIIAITDELKVKYASEEFSYELNEIAGGFQFLSKKEFHATIHVMLQLKEKKRLSTAALETLAIIAYKQPISKPELEHIRGVSCDYSIQKLLEKELIVIAGKSDGPGKPLLYATSKNFMDHFGLRSVKDLPKLKDIQSLDANEIGLPLGIEENIPVELETASDEQEPSIIEEVSDAAFPENEADSDSETVSQQGEESEEDTNAEDPENQA